MVTKFQGPTIQEQGVRFAVVIVQPHIISNPDKTEANRLITTFSIKVFGVPVVLMAQDSRGTPTYYGRKDLVEFLANVPLESVPWQEFTFTE
ncbi:MAG TPA: hypothetical protein VHU83_22035 [Bryobacteraceae bacterium]|jgi:hypothetical protein|nr:hypothetical protein [Bryobacteraceae bacterium]